jgi:hypothetical protein
VSGNGGLTCPSSACRPGNLLIGIVMPDGRVGSVEPPLEVDAAFADRVSADPGTPGESRFRFARECVTTACRQWRNDQCQVGHAAATVAERLEIVEGLPRCAIRSTCRWWQQEGRAACAACQWVVHTSARAETPNGTMTDPSWIATEAADTPHPTEA